MATELDAEFRERLREFSARLTALVQSEPSADGIGEYLLGYGAGMLMRIGDTEQQVHAALEAIFERTREQRMKLQAQGDA